MRRSVPLFLAFSLIACGSDDDSSGLKQQVIADYKQVVLRNYEDALAHAKRLEQAVVAFTNTPTAESHEAAKQAWLAARVPYGPSEVFRFYEGPIDTSAGDGGPEGLINGWPLDENYIDYTRDNPSAGIINKPEQYRELSASVLAEANEAAGERAISTGFHAIEFLLWGQDDVKPGSGAGKRSYTDFLVQGGSNQNQARRAEYLRVAAQLLVQHLEQVTAAWRVSPGSYGERFGVAASEPGKSAEDEALSAMMVGIGFMAKTELAGERMSATLAMRSQEDEHSCFSDSTATDLLGNGRGIQNVWLGQYGDFDGKGLYDVVAEVDRALADKTSADIATAVAKLTELHGMQQQGTPIDVLVEGDDTLPGRMLMSDAVAALKEVASDIERGAAALKLVITLEEPAP